MCRETLLISFLLLITLGPQLSWSAPSSCFESLEHEDLAIAKLKGQVFCANSSIGDCKKLFLGMPESSKKTEIESPLICASSPINQLKALPLATPKAAGLKNILDFISRQRRSYVNTLADFHHHTKMHKKRVQRLGLKLLDHFPEEFKGIDRQMAVRLLADHDNAKMSSRYRYRNGRPFYAELYDHFGKRPPQDLVNRLNLADSNIMEKAFKREGLGLNDYDSPNERGGKLELRAKFNKLEKLADFTDRAMNPVSPEEFGRKMWSETRAAIKEGDRSKAKMARYLEKNYQQFVGDLFYKKLSPSAHLAASQKLATHQKFGSLIGKASSIKELSARALNGGSRLLGTKPLSRAGKLGARLAFTTAAVLDVAFLSLFPSSMGCTSTPGHHDWEKDSDGACTPVLGLSPMFISFLSLPKEKRQMEYKNSDHMCEVTQANLKENETPTFPKVKCHDNSATLSTQDNERQVEVFFDQGGNISRLDLDKISIRSSPFSRPPNKAIFERGRLVSECFLIGRGGTNQSCKKANDQNSAYTKFFSPLNYRVYQAVSCCLGQKGLHNKLQSCEST
jgi:hypothetical protein